MDKTHLSDKLIELTKRQEEVKQLKKAASKDYRDQLKDINDEIKDVLDALERI